MRRTAALWLARCQFDQQRPPGRCARWWLTSSRSQTLKTMDSISLWMVLVSGGSLPANSLFPVLIHFKVHPSHWCCPTDTVSINPATYTLQNIILFKKSSSFIHIACPSHLRLPHHPLNHCIVHSHFYYTHTINLIHILITFCIILTPHASLSSWFPLHVFVIAAYIPHSCLMHVAIGRRVLFLVISFTP